MLLAAAPQLYEAGGEPYVVFNDARDVIEGWGELADNLRAGLDAAALGRSQDADNASRED